LLNYQTFLGKLAGRMGTFGRLSGLRMLNYSIINLESIRLSYTTIKLLFYWLEITNLFVTSIITTQGTQQKIIT